MTRSDGNAIHHEAIPMSTRASLLRKKSNSFRVLC